RGRSGAEGCASGSAPYLRRSMRTELWSHPSECWAGLDAGRRRVGFGGSDFDEPRPAVGIGHAPVLNVGQSIEHSARHRSGLAGPERIVLSLKAETADRSDDRTGAHAERFRDFPGLDIAHDLMDVDPIFLDRKAEVGCKFQQGIARHTSQN